MQIYVDNKLAALKQGTSFEYVSENRMFSGSDGYTFTITFPLKDCPQNTAIFGHINRADVSAGKVIFDCEIRDRSFYRFGCITVTEISEAEVKTQFLDGRSEQNFDKTFDKVYINELDLGRYPTGSKTPFEAWEIDPGNPTEVALPWVNDASGNIQNCASFDNASGTYSWTSTSYGSGRTDTSRGVGLSWQIYLIEATRRICAAIGYDCDLSAWAEKEEFIYLLICNTLPYAWFTPEYARALPHWTVEEYFEKLELFLGCEFDIDHRAKKINFAFSDTMLRVLPDIQLDDVIEEHSTEINVEDTQCEYIEAKNLVYKDCDHEMWKFYSCDWLVKSWKATAQQYDTLTELLAACQSFRTWNGTNYRGSIFNKLLYAKDVDCYFALNAISRVSNGSNRPPYWTYTCIVQPINLFGGRIVDDGDDAAEEEIEFVPAWIDHTDDTYGRCLFLSFSGYDEADDSTVNVRTSSDAKTRWSNSSVVNSLEAGETDKKAEYYDRIYIGWWDGALQEWGKLPYPNVENIIITDDMTHWRYGHFSLRLNGGKAIWKNIARNIKPDQKTTFKWLSDTIPNVRSLFLIRGKRYICEKITATFTENGMSQLLKGVFYPLQD